MELKWQDRANCIGKQEYFFNDMKRTSVSKAKELCADCEVRSECLQYALRLDVVGVWGGLTANERAKLRRAERKSRRGV